MSPSFCRHNRFVQNCPICRPAEPEVTRSLPARSPGSTSARPTSGQSGRPRTARTGAVRVRRLAQAADDGFRSPLVAGIKASADAERLVDELAFAYARLQELEDDPPGPYADVVVLEDAEEALWLAFLVAFLAPLDQDDPFAAIRAAHVPWAAGELPALDVAHGRRSAAADPAAGERTITAYRAWAQRAGGQQAAYAGEPSWTPERRFDRIFERLALPGFGRAARYELLVSLAWLDRVDARPATLRLTDDATTLAAKRVFGIGDTILLERRARALADAADLPIETLDLALFNWGERGGARATCGSRAVVDPERRAAIADALGV